MESTHATRGTVGTLGDTRGADVLGAAVALALAATSIRAAEAAALLAEADNAFLMRERGC